MIIVYSQIKTSNFSQMRSARQTETFARKLSVTHIETERIRTHGERVAYIIVYIATLRGLP